MENKDPLDSRLLTILSMTALGVIVVSIVSNIVLRTFFNKPIKWILEVNGIMVVWLTFMTLGVNDRQDRHFKVEIITHKTSAFLRGISHFTKEIVVFCCIASLIYFCYIAIKDNFTIKTSVTEWRVWIAYYLPALIGSIHGLYAIVRKYLGGRYSSRNSL